MQCEEDPPCSERIHHAVRHMLEFGHHVVAPALHTYVLHVLQQHCRGAHLAVALAACQQGALALGCRQVVDSHTARHGAADGQLASGVQHDPDAVP